MIAGERLVEDAVVLGWDAGPPATAELRLVAGEGCEECAARLICRPEDGERRRLRLLSPEPLATGARVRVEVGGGRALAASLWLYGGPLAGFVAGTLAGWALLPATPARERLAFAAGLAGVALAWGLARLHLRRAGDDWLVARLLP